MLTLVGLDLQSPQDRSGNLWEPLLLDGLLERVLFGATKVQTAHSQHLQLIALLEVLLLILLKQGFWKVKIMRALFRIFKVIPL